MKKNKHTIRQGQTFFLIGLTEKDPDSPYDYDKVYVGTGMSKDKVYDSLDVKAAKILIKQCERIGLHVAYSRNKAVRIAKELNLDYKKRAANGFK